MLIKKGQSHNIKITNATLKLYKSQVSVNKSNKSASVSGQIMFVIFLLLYFSDSLFKFKIICGGDLK